MIEASRPGFSHAADRDIAIDKTHWQYGDVNQTFSWSYCIMSCIRYYARCRNGSDQILVCCSSRVL